jgi:uncharacterized membrane protein
MAQAMRIVSRVQLSTRRITAFNTSALYVVFLLPLSYRRLTPHRHHQVWMSSIFPVFFFYAI